MKKVFLTIISAALLSGLIACSNQNDEADHNEQNVVNSSEKDKKINVEKDVREVVWGQLSSEQKEWIDGTWEVGKVSKVTLIENMMSQVTDKSYEGKEVYLIDFPTITKYKPNNMIVYADIITFDYIGNGLVD